MQPNFDNQAEHQVPVPPMDSSGQSSGLSIPSAVEERSVTFSPYLDEREQQMDDDYEWCLNSRDLHRAYGGQVVMVYKRKIWGAGKDHRAAWEMACREPECPPRHDMAGVVVPEYIPIPGESE